MKVEPKLKQRPARRAGRLGTRVSANLSGLWRLACLVAQCAVEPAQAAVLEVGLSKPYPEPSKAIAAAPWSAGGFQVARPDLQNMHVGEFSRSLRSFTIVLALLHCQR